MKLSACFLAAASLLSACQHKAPLLPDTSLAETAFQSLKMSPQAAFATPKVVEDNVRGGHEENEIPVKGDPVARHPAMIVRNANIQFQVKDALASHNRIEALVKQNGAYFSSDNKQNDAARIELNMDIRVPSAALDKLMSALMEESVYTNYKNITAEDITADFVDTETRLRTKQAVEQRYLTILKQAGKVSDILAVESQLATIREEIESAQGRLKLMNDQVTYSTIHLQAYQTLSYHAGPEIGFTSRMEESFVNGWKGFIGLIIGLTAIWPFVLISGSIIGWLIAKRSRLHGSANS